MSGYDSDPQHERGTTVYAFGLRYPARRRGITAAHPIDRRSVFRVNPYSQVADYRRQPLLQGANINTQITHMQNNPPVPLDVDRSQRVRPSRDRPNRYRRRHQTHRLYRRRQRSSSRHRSRSRSRSRSRTPDSRRSISPNHRSRSPRRDNRRDRSAPRAEISGENANGGGHDEIADAVFDEMEQELRQTETAVDTTQQQQAPGQNLQTENVQPTDHQTLEARLAALEQLIYFYMSKFALLIKI